MILRRRFLTLISLSFLVRHVQRLAADGDLPYIFAGDFNLKPTDTLYRLLTTGEIDRDDPCHPEPKNGVEWAPSQVRPVRSAYAASSSGEPDFTNYARIKENPPFIDTLDYIFISESWKVEGVLELPKQQESGGPFPNLDRGEPSDHVLIAANLAL